MSWKESLFKQHNIGQLWGKFALAGTQISIFITGYTFIMVSVNAYIPIAGWFVTYGIRFAFWFYMMMIVLPVIVAYILSWKFLVKSFYLSWAEQFWRESKDYIEAMEQIKKQNDKIINELANLEGKLK